VSYIILGGFWCRVIILNVHEPSEDKSNDSKINIYEKPEHIFDQFSKYNTKVSLGNFNAKVGREDKCKTAIDNESLHVKRCNF